MEIYGMLIDYEYCVGCQTCEVACQKFHDYDIDKRGLKVSQIGPYKLPGGKWQLDNLPLHTVYCNRCLQRTVKGKLPACMHHCQSGCIEVGKIEDLIPKMTKEKMVLYTL